MSENTLENERAPYILGYGDASVSWMITRNVENHAQFFLPYLVAGMKLLDCGCGPGSISVGLAEIMAPVDMVAMDIELSQVKLTRARADQHGVTNLICREGSILAIPFESESFDAVFVSAVLGNLAHPEQALDEIYRVLKTGGVIGIREFDHGGNLIYPSSPTIEKSVAIYDAIREENNHAKEFGRTLRSALYRAGFELLHINASYETIGDRTGVKGYAQAIINLFREFLGQQALRLGLIDSEGVDAIIHDWEEWGKDPHAFFAAAWVDVVGRKS